MFLINLFLTEIFISKVRNGNAICISLIVKLKLNSFCCLSPPPSIFWLTKNLESHMINYFEWLNVRETTQIACLLEEKHDCV